MTSLERNRLGGFHAARRAACAAIVLLSLGGAAAGARADEGGAARQDPSSAQGTLVFSLSPKSYSALTQALTGGAPGQRLEKFFGYLDPDAPARCWFKVLADACVKEVKMWGDNINRADIYVAPIWTLKDKGGVLSLVRTECQGQYSTDLPNQSFAFTDSRLASVYLVPERIEITPIFPADPQYTSLFNNGDFLLNHQPDRRFGAHGEAFFSVIEDGYKDNLCCAITKPEGGRDLLVFRRQGNVFERVGDIPLRTISEREDDTDENPEPDYSDMHANVEFRKDRDGEVIRILATDTEEGSAGRKPYKRTKSVGYSWNEAKKLFSPETK